MLRAYHEYRESGGRFSEIGEQTSEDSPHFGAVVERLQFRVVCSLEPEARRRKGVLIN